MIGNLATVDKGFGKLIGTHYQVSIPRAGQVTKRYWWSILAVTPVPEVDTGHHVYPVRTLLSFLESEISRDQPRNQAGR